MMEFSACEVCGADVWRVLYQGAVRDGAFGSTLSDGIVGLCGNCNTARLSEKFCISDEDYQTPAYREKLRQTLDIAAHKAEHDPFQRFSIDAVEHLSLRNAVLADIGCAAGTFLDHVRGLTGRVVGIEPNAYFHAGLRAQGTEIYNYAGEAAKAIPGEVDIATAFQVIEHCTNPVQFLRDIRALLKPNGMLVLTTPNRNDVLLDLLPDVFPAFFFRAVHRWYFDAPSLIACAEASGYQVERVRFMHRYGLSNALAWLRDRRPTGWTRLPGVSEDADLAWKLSLQRSGQADNIVIYLTPLN